MMKTSLSVAELTELVVTAFDCHRRALPLLTLCGHYR